MEKKISIQQEILSYLNLQYLERYGLIEEIAFFTSTANGESKNQNLNLSWCSLVIQ
jgi:hypothetical protein